MNKDDDSVKIFTDGACLGNPGPGGWGVLMQWRGHEREFSGGEAHTTNNRMELMAAIRGIETLKRPSRVILTTDSNYVKDGVTKWLISWKCNDWKTSAKKPVKNVDLWKRLDKAIGNHEVDWCWVKGHSGHIENERADNLAAEQARFEAEKGAALTEI